MVYSPKKYRETEGRKVRRIGIDISTARMQQELYDLGIRKNVNSLTQADKSLLRYIAIMKQTTNAQGDMAATIMTPANAFRVLSAQVEIASRWIGAVFIPLITRALQWVIPLVKAIGMVAKGIAQFVGFEMPEITMPEKPTKYLEDTEDGLDNVGSAAKKAKKDLDHLIGGFDELNVLNENTADVGGGVGASADLGNILGDIELPEYDMFARFVETNIDERAKELKAILDQILPIVLGIGVGFLTWKIAKGLYSGLQAIITGLTRIGGLSAALGTFGAWAVVIAFMAGRFAQLYASSEKFRKGLERIGEIGKIAFDGIGEILGVIWDGIKGIGKDIYDLLPPSVQNSITKAFETIKEVVKGLDLDVGDLLITLAGIGLLFIPGGQILGIALLGFEAITVGIRALGLLSDEQFEKIKQTIKKAFDGAVAFVKWDIDLICGIIGGIITFIVGVFTQDWDTAWKGLTKIVKSVVNAINSAIKKLFGIDLKNTVKDWFNNNVKVWFTADRWKQLGLDAATALISGLKKLLTFDLDFTGASSSKSQKGGNSSSGSKNRSGINFNSLTADTYATGGYPQKAQLFYARENGIPEMVGSIGGQTAVANNDQIVTAIENGVLRAMTAALGANSGTQEINLNIVTELDGQTVYRNQQKVAAGKGYNFGMGAFAR